jgi:hypothetical protein
MNVILLMRRIDKMPSQIVAEPMIWINRINEVLYHFGQQGIDF